MSKNKLPKLYRRKWINKDKGSAYIIVDADVEAGYGSRKDDRSVDASVEIKDCHRQSSLEFYYHNKKTYVQRLKKIRLLIEALQELEGFMLANEPLNVSKKKRVKFDTSPVAAAFDD